MSPAAAAGTSVIVTRLLNSHGARERHQIVQQGEFGIWLELLKHSCVESAIQAADIVNCVHRVEIRGVFCITTELSARQKISCCLSTGVSLKFESAPLRLVYREVTGLLADRLGEYKHSVLLI
ncbi:Uncharacterised protein [Enterobacter hormaechei]|nr:Uncharacterised protein [Enterobacter hormaechei]CZY91534.1 Uncharacterised protein [Enterobacter hormaechei]VAE42377.1 Uncharacterised protein [Enterobacter hormaechei]